MLHVLNGDIVREKLEGSGVPGTFLVWTDVLHVGPCRLLPADDWRRMRSRHIGAQGFVAEEQVLARYEAADATLDTADAHDEVVFWFEHDLYDQLLLIRHLHWISARAGSQTTYSLICIGDFPGVPDFSGLGQLSVGDLASLFDTRHAITGEEIALGRRAWTAFCAPDPTALVQLLGDETSALPFLAGALRRFLEDYPDVTTGLSRSERQILEAAESGAASLNEAFRHTQRMEERIFMGDWTWATIVRGLASGTRPLVETDPPADPERLLEAGLRITGTGREALAGALDHVAINGIDRWMGGVHLTDGRWRWDGERVRPR